MPRRAPLSLRLGDATLERLTRRAARAALPVRTLAQRYVEEGVRMDEHPLVHFAEGPAGRRARIVGSGKDVWEIVAAVLDNGVDVAATAEYLHMPTGHVQAAVAYYGAYTDEVDGWIAANRGEADEAHAAWLAGRAALAR